ncbi:MAG: type II restriction endonuclease [Chloracidobacterium sp.]|nr:type II restriction endonuclease [Chloracidobacterium sp.]
MIDRKRIGLLALAVMLLLAGHAFGQAAERGLDQGDATELGSRTAKGGFRNEDEIRDKFNSWKTDEDAKKWLAAMNHDLSKIENVLAAKPHGEKADVEVRVKTKAGEKVEGISIKLVSNPNGFNQIDKRWLATYAKMWRMPTDVVAALRLFVGETPPLRSGRDPKRMYLNELDDAARQAVVDFFTTNRDEIVSDLFKGDGTHAASWFMVAFKPAVNTQWTLRNTDDVIKFYGEGKIEITRTGNLKIGRITMQRKGGDGGRETAKMLQFKINPALLFDAK